MSASIIAIVHALDALEHGPQRLRSYPSVPAADEPDYPCYACGAESTHEIIHRGSPLDVCDACDIEN